MEEVDASELAYFLKDLRDTDRGELLIRLEEAKEMIPGFDYDYAHTEDNVLQSSLTLVALSRLVINSNESVH
jgi:hypothetical protein